MTRILVHAPRLDRRPHRARRATVAKRVPVDFEAERIPPRWLIVGTGVLGLLPLTLTVVGLVVIA